MFALWDYVHVPADDTWPTAARLAYLTLLCLRLSASLLIFVVLARFLGTDDTSPPAAYQHGTKYYKFMCEYTVLLLAFCPVLFDSCTVFVSHKHSTSGSVGWISCGLTLVLVAYTVYSFVFQVLKTLIPLVWYRPDDKTMSNYLGGLYFSLRNDTWRALGDRYVAGAASESTRDKEDLWHVRLVQAGVADDKGEADGLGGSYAAKPAVYVVSPASFLPSSALEIQQLDSLSLGLFCGSFTRCFSLWVSLSVCLCIVSDSSYSLTHTLTITITCCYDEIKGTQDLKIYSHADSQILTLSTSRSFAAHGSLYCCVSVAVCF